MTTPDIAEARRLAEQLKERFGATVPTSQAAAMLHALAAEVERLRAQVAPAGLLNRIDSAMKRIEDGHCPRRIPADPTDVDLVLAECRAVFTGKWPPFWIKPDAPAQQAGQAPAVVADDAKDAARFRWLIDERNWNENEDTPSVCTSEDVHWGNKARALIDRHMETQPPVADKKEQP